MVAEDFCHAIGYRRVTRRDRSALAVRADVMERLARDAYKMAAATPRAAVQADGIATEPALFQPSACPAPVLGAVTFVPSYCPYPTIGRQSRMESTTTLTRRP